MIPLSKIFNDDVILLVKITFSALLKLKKLQIFSLVSYNTQIYNIFRCNIKARITYYQEELNRVLSRFF